jgi:hypothetical protein
VNDGGKGDERDCRKDSRVLHYKIEMIGRLKECSSKRRDELEGNKLKTWYLYEIQEADGPDLGLQLKPSRSLNTSGISGCQPFMNYASTTWKCV